MNRIAHVRARHPFRLSLGARRTMRWGRITHQDVREFLLAYIAGLLALGAFLA